MNKIKSITLLLVTLLCLFPCNVKAEVWTPETLPMVHLQDSTRFVCNPDGVMSEEAVAKTDQILRSLKRTKGVETVVAVVKKIENGDPYQFGMDLSRKYGIGDKEQRTGLIIILSTEDRAYQFLTGNGLEGTLPDGLCYNIQQEVMVPALKDGDWDKAIYESVVAVNGIIMGDESITRRFEETSGSNSDLLWGVIVLVGVLGISLYSNKKKKQCPKCKANNALVMVNSRRVRIGSSRYTKTTWKCKKCGHIVERNEEDSTNDSNSTGGGFTIFGGGGSHHSGGGFGGGSFGGGSFGGGGSGGRF